MSNENKIHVSLDIETLGLDPCSAVWQIGACVIGNPELDFKYTINPANAIVRYDVNQDTLNWQLNKNMDNYSLALEVPDTPNVDQTPGMLYALSDWLNSLGAKVNTRIWVKGPHFDISILTALYNLCSIEIPWKYNSIRDMRTLESLLSNMVDFSIITKPIGLHDALVDAKYQADIIELGLRHVKKL